MDEKEAKKMMRKIQRETQKPNHDPDTLLESLGITPNYTDHNPSLDEYDLPEGIEEKIEREVADFEAGKKRRAGYWFFGIIAVGTSIGYALNGREGAMLGAFLGFWPTSFVSLGLVYEAINL